MKGGPPGADDDEFDDDDDDEELFVPDRVLARPNLGTQQPHATKLWEEAAVLGALRDALLAADFSFEDAQEMTSQYAGIWWSAKYEKEAHARDD